MEIFHGCDGTALPVRIWMPEGRPKLILQITHGMTEHMGRYENFAREMNARGIGVAGFDLRGHGQNPGDPLVASFGPDGWEASLQDMHLFFQYLEARFPGAPHYMLGFSLGSFLLREYLGRWSDGVCGAIIMGTGDQPGLVLSVMMAIVKGQIQKAGFDACTDLVRSLSFGSYNQKFRPNRTASDWLCADTQALDDYLSDSLCRRDISAGLFWQLLAAMKRAGHRDACRNWNREMPVLLLSGLEDPVGDFGKGVRRVHRQMETAGLRQVSLQLPPGARHILLGEEKSGAAREAVCAIAGWLPA